MNLQSLRMVFAQMDADRKERFASAFDSEYSDVAKWVRKNGIPKQIFVPDGYVTNPEAIQPLINCFEKWNIEIVRTPLIRQAAIYLIADEATKIEVDLRLFEPPKQ